MRVVGAGFCSAGSTPFWRGWYLCSAVSCLVRPAIYVLGWSKLGNCWFRKRLFPGPWQLWLSEPFVVEPGGCRGYLVVSADVALINLAVGAFPYVTNLLM